MQHQHQHYYLRDQDGTPVKHGHPCPGMLEAYGPIPGTKVFQRSYMFEKPKEIHGWDWSHTFRRWGALVTFKDGVTLFTWPIDPEHAYMRKQELAEKAGFTIVDNGTGCGWYALLPGQKEFHDDGEGGQNYLGFFSSREDLLDEVEERIADECLAKHGTTLEAWENLYHHEQALIASRLFQP